MALTRPEFPWSLFEAGPTGVQVLLESGLVGSIVKMRKLAVVWSATGSPSPVLVVVFGVAVIDQPVSVPAPLPAFGDRQRVGARLALAQQVAVDQQRLERLELAEERRRAVADQASPRCPGRRCW